MRYVFLRRGRIEVVSTYKYLAVIFDDFLEFDAGVKALAGGAGRGLGKIFSTHKRLHGMGYKTFTTMYEGMVDPIILYGAGVWGLKRFGCTEAVQNRAQRIFLGVHKYACNEAVNGDMGWRTVATKQKIWVLRLWNHLCEIRQWENPGKNPQTAPLVTLCNGTLTEYTGKPLYNGTGRAIL